MFKFAVVLLAFVAFAAAKPGIVAPLAYNAPLVAAAPAAAVYSREYHGNFAAPYVAAQYAAAAPLVASPYAAAPVVASPYTAAAAPVVASPYTAAAAYPGYLASPYTAAYTSPYLLK